MINKNIIKLIGGGVLITTTAVVSIIGAVVESEKKHPEKPNNGIYSDGYFKVVDTIVDSAILPIFTKSELIKVIPQYKENGFYNAIIAVIESDMPDKVKSDTITAMCK